MGLAFSRREQSEQSEQYKQREQSEQYEQREQYEQYEQREQSEQSEQYEQLVQYRQSIRLSSAFFAASSEPKYSTLHWFPFASDIQVIGLLFPFKTLHRNVVCPGGSTKCLKYLLKSSNASGYSAHLSLNCGAFHLFSLERLFYRGGYRPTMQNFRHNAPVNVGPHRHFFGNAFVGRKIAPYCLSPLRPDLQILELLVPLWCLHVV